MISILIFPIIVLIIAVFLLESNYHRLTLRFLELESRVNAISKVQVFHTDLITEKESYSSNKRAHDEISMRLDALDGGRVVK